MRERRFGFRVPYEVMMTSYVKDRPVRALAADLSDTGVCMSSVSVLAPSLGSVVGLEFNIPGIADSIWAAGEICHRRGASVATEVGVRFVAMARTHARLVRDYCVESRREHLGSLLAKIRGPVPTVAR